jgi:hypothetical protein
VETKPKKMSTNQKNYWVERYENLPDYIVVQQDMDGLTGYTVIHKKDENEFYSRSYRGSIILGLSLDKSKMEKLAKKMNKKN